MGNEILQAIPTLEKDIPADQFLVQDFWIPLAWCCAILIPLASVAAIWFYRRRKGIITGIAPFQEALETRDVLEHLAEFKYAGATEQNPAQARALIEQTRNLIARIHNAREQEQNKEVSA